MTRVTRDLFIDSGEQTGAYNMALRRVARPALASGAGGPVAHGSSAGSPGRSPSDTTRGPASSTRHGARATASTSSRRPTGRTRHTPRRRTDLQRRDARRAESVLAGVQRDQHARSSADSPSTASRSHSRSPSQTLGKSTGARRRSPASAAPPVTRSNGRARKLVGSAQRRFPERGGDVVLQHGSILCGPAHLRLADYLLVADAQRASRSARSGKENSRSRARSPEPRRHAAARRMHPAGIRGGMGHHIRSRLLTSIPRTNGMRFP